MENSMEFPQKIKKRTTVWSSNPTFGYIWEGNKIIISKRYLHPHIHCSIIHNSQDMETTEVSIDRWMNKNNIVLAILGLSTLHTNLKSVCGCPQNNFLGFCLELCWICRSSWEELTSCNIVSFYSYTYSIYYYRLYLHQGFIVFLI